MKGHTPESVLTRYGLSLQPRRGAALLRPISATPEPRHRSVSYPLAPPKLSSRASRGTCFLPRLLSARGAPQVNPVRQLWGNGAKKNLVIPTEATRLFLAHGLLCAGSRISTSRLCLCSARFPKRASSFPGYNMCASEEKIVAAKPDFLHCVGKIRADAGSL